VNVGASYPDRGFVLRCISESEKNPGPTPAKSPPMWITPLPAQSGKTIYEHPLSSTSALVVLQTLGF